MLNAKKEKERKEKVEKTKRLHEWMLSLWNKITDKKCTSCGKKIWGEFSTLYFDHLLPKKKYPEFEFEEKNIYFCCGTCHEKKENGFPTPSHKAAIDKAKELLIEKEE